MQFVGRRLAFQAQRAVQLFSRAKQCQLIEHVATQRDVELRVVACELLLRRCDRCLVAICACTVCLFLFVCQILAVANQHLHAAPRAHAHCASWETGNGSTMVRLDAHAYDALFPSWPGLTHTYNINESEKLLRYVLVAEKTGNEKKVRSKNSKSRQNRTDFLPV